ncbi:MAG: hypothetical protein JEZ04_11145 [Spirochaetales bacterium]|nr:hypothetical protein [Spirochaetales bacterium]
MKIISAELFLLKIPFKMNFAHSKADRFFSDSIILKLTALDDSGFPVTGWGEAVVREYVSGSLGEGDRQSLLKSAFARLLPFRMLELSKEELLDAVRFSEASETELPLLCAVETAVLDLLCRAEKVDIYSLLGLKPVRRQIIYGGTLPILQPQAAEKLLEGYRKMGINNLRIKLGSNFEYNRDVVGLTQKIMGKGFDLKVDANAGWSLADAAENIPMIVAAGIKIIEEPFGREEAGESRISELSPDGLTDGLTFMADESALTAADIRRAAEEKTFGMFNIRLAKNGGLLRALSMAEEAEHLGLRYMAGCHVGETGILSAAGRAAASIMGKPEYTDGSYDLHLLSGNITKEDLSFGPGGAAEIIRDNGLGYEIDEEKLKGYTNERIDV